MTTTTAPRLATPRFGMAWVTWRQHRAALAGACGVLGAAIAYMLVTGLRMRSALNSLGVSSCHPAAAARCGQLMTLFNADYDVWRNNGLIVMQVLPLFVGVFVGSPLLARELETGTFRFAWTQGTGRTRWAIVKLTLVAAVVTGAAALVSLVCSWWLAPFIAEGWSRMGPNVFPLTGLAFPAWTLAAFVLGAFAGTLIRRTVPALATAMVVWAGLAIGTANYLRWRYQSPLATSPRTPGEVPVPGGSWIRTTWIGPGGHPVSLPALGLRAAKLAGLQSQTAHQALRGYRVVLTYQPGSRYWHFQLIEVGWLLAMVLVLGLATMWLVRHRAA
jgi:hypothetical protein